ncbi:antitermination regulator [Mycobacterium sp. E3251]|uniref:PAS and ANTAR domain-containing protein n=1 Tax=unclassified Mycobacterium TaxID=2642494 RepID=UPI0007FF2327|nr:MULTISPECIES: PAS and ANTAR domain-containing protein [unclassified Mycobacterium]OBG99231.1 antitermination regulator [Mycobacterium sp. E3251]OBI25779.1 antitermination regulator [Mycobacterium sp. E1386]
MIADFSEVKDDDAVVRALAAGSPQRMGTFRFYFDGQRWEWCEQVARLHGYEPGTVTPTTELVLAHKHPDDRRQIAATLDDIRRDHGPFSTRHRIIDVQGNVHHVVVIGNQLVDAVGEVVGTEGFYIDVTPTDDVVQDALTAEVEKFSKNRAIIERAKGMLMVIYGIDETTAFALLRWRSQENNVRLRPLARRIVAEFLALSRREVHPLRSAYDDIVLTVHLRIVSRDG